MFSDIDSPTTPFGLLNRGSFGHGDSPKSFHFSSVVGSAPTLAALEQPPALLSIPAPAPPERRGGGSRGSINGSQKGATVPSSIVGSTRLALPSINTRMKAGSTTGPRILSQCNEYYFDHAIPIVVILVQGHLFKVHRHFLERDSLLLRGVLSTVQEPQIRPLEMQGISSREFTALLDFFYQGMYRDHKMVPVSEWMDLLAAASVLKFDRVLEHAIAAIDSAISHVSETSTESVCPDAVDMIILAERFGVRKWLRPAYISLCKREEPLSLEEAEKIGSIEKVVKLTRAREEFLRQTLGVNESGAVSPAQSPYPWTTRVHVQGIGRKPKANLVDEAENVVDRVFFNSSDDL
ncbi:hypothetical protein D9757_000925 [Collybiopsis confluens]|uniref:BTB domain-containing protein n=1 Tax=Collybiopsis confluens TaxID=2823264 RepID=A0A8H5I0J5_9AGAR|nr:hypothetical protein D9757_000925 [Collybiopsis confluens]